MKFLMGILSFVMGQQALGAALVYVPQNFKPDSARVMVVIHGCLQTPESMALGTGWNSVAETENLMVIYPRVPEGSNAMDCWNWFEPENQRADSGQLFEIQQEILHWKAVMNIPRAAVYATGISAGAAMVAGLLACYPKDFFGGAIHSGPSYGLADSLAMGKQVLAQGALGLSRKGVCDPSNFKRPFMIIQGSLDPVVNPLNVKRLADDFLSGLKFKIPVNGQANSLFYTTVDYTQDRHLKGRIVYIHGLGHAWSGYGDHIKNAGILGPKTDLPFFSTQGPNATSMIMDFFNTAMP